MVIESKDRLIRERLAIDSGQTPFLTVREQAWSFTNNYSREAATCSGDKLAYLR
jgi:hypothetical protein